MKRLLAAGAVLVLLLVMAVGGGLGYLNYRASSIQLPPLQIGTNSVVYGDNGKILGYLPAAGTAHVTLTEGQISPLLRQAHMAAEDRGFYRHGAISIVGIGRAVVTDLKDGSIAAGGSTITQQYVKNAYLSQEQTASRKFREILYAYKVEKEFTKDQILTNYLNTNYYGRGTYGIADASEVWFGRPATQIRNIHDPLQVAQAAFLAALISQPSYFAEAVPGHPDQLLHMSDLVARQIYVLDGLRAVQGVNPQDMVSSSVIAQAKQLLPLQITSTTSMSGDPYGADPYLASYVKDWLAAWQTQVAEQDGLSDQAAVRRGQSAAEALLARGGLKIRTSINSNLQHLLTQAVATRLPGGLSTGVVILNPQTGAVEAIYSGTNQGEGSYNYALYAERQIGSTMKSFVLADAVNHGVSVQSVFAAPPYVVVNGSQIWNDDHTAAPNCRLSLADAVAESNNPVNVELITGQMGSCNSPNQLTPIGSDPISPTSVVNLAHQMGADDSLVPGVTNPAQLDPVPSLALGTSSLTPLKVASMGAALDNGGIHTKPSLVQQPIGSLAQTPQPLLTRH